MRTNQPEQFFNPNKSYYENFDEGPFGAFADGTVVEDTGDSRYTLFGHKLSIPFGIPAGPLLNGTFVKAALDKGFSISMYKTVRTKKRICHPWPNVLPVAVEGDLTIEKAQKRLTTTAEYNAPLSITNSFGNPSYDPDFWQKDMKDAVSHAHSGQMVTASIEGTRRGGYSDQDYVDDWVLGAKLLKETGVHFIEANLSCPNEGTTALLCYDTDRVQIICDAIKNEIGDFPLVLKISYFVDDAALKDFVTKVGAIVDGLSAINTISAEVVDSKGNQALPGEGRLQSGVCGHAIKWAGIDMTRRLHKLRSKCNVTYAIIGVGGVTTAEDFNEYMEAGADAVMSATGTMWNPLLAKEVTELLRV